jgi:Sulfatase
MKGNSFQMKAKHPILIDVLHIFVLFSFAFAQPIFDLLGNNPEFFVVRRSSPTNIVLLVITLAVGAPAMAALIEWLASLIRETFRKGVHGLFVATLTALIALPILKRAGHLPDAAIIGGAILLGVGLGVACLRSPLARLFLTALSPGIVIFPALFLFHSQVRKIVFPKAEVARTNTSFRATAPVVVIVFDEFSSVALMDENRQVDPILYPNFASFSKESTWFRNATTVSPATERAVTAILTGLRPELKRLPMAADYPHNLYTLLGGAYRMKVVEPITSLCPGDLCGDIGPPLPMTASLKALFMDLSAIYLHVILPPHLATRLPVVTQSWDDFWGQGKTSDGSKWKKSTREMWHEPVAQFSSFLESIDKTDQPTLYFLHVALPHVPWRYLPSGKSYAGQGLKVPGLNFKVEVWRNNKWLVLRGYQRYLLQVGYVDRLLGKLITRLKELDVFDKSLIVIMSDHGVSFHPGEKRRKAVKENFQDIMPIPLFVKAPHQRTGLVSDRNVQSIDILPTIADILGGNLPWVVDGSSAWNPSAPEQSVKVIYGTKSAEDNIQVSAAFPEKYSALKEKLALFGSGSTPSGIFKLGPYPDLLGKQVRDIGVEGKPEVTLELDQVPALFSNYNRDSDFVPAFISGEARPDGKVAAGPLDLAIAVNGIVQAVTRSFSAEDSESWSSLDTGREVYKFAALVPETSFQEGDNKVELYVVSRKAGGREWLIPTVMSSQVTYSLLSSDNPQNIESSQGSSFSISPDAVHGSVSVKQRGSTYVISGWAADIKNAQRAETVIIFAGDKGIFSVSPSVPRPDVARYFKIPSLQNTGFILTIPSYLLEGSQDGKLKIFAVSKTGVASQLKNPD